MKNNKVLITLIVCIAVIMLPLIGYYIYRSTNIQKNELKQQCLTIFNTRRSEIEKRKSEDKYYMAEADNNSKINQEQYDNCLKDVGAIR